jgi:hypothetical protein
MIENVIEIGFDTLKELSLQPRRGEYWLKLWNKKEGGNYLIILRTMHLETLDENCKK